MHHTQALAEFCSTLTYERLPKSIVHTTKRLMLDSIGTTLAGTTLGDGCTELFNMATKVDSVPEASLIGRRRQVPALMAALVNGGTGHALNFDSSGPIGHVGSIFAAPLAAAQCQRMDDGHRLVAAFAAGCETIARLAAVIRANNIRGEIPVDKVLEGQLLGYFGAAAASGVVLGLNAKQMHSAFGIALMQAAGTMQVVFDGDPPAKAIYAAFSNHGGLLSALMAHNGIRGDIDVFGGRAGLFGLYYNDGWDISPITLRLGEEFLFTNANFKPWPSSGVTHPFVEAASRLGKFQPSEIAEIWLRGGTRSRHWFEPEDERRKPITAAAAANSVFYTAARILETGSLSLADFRADALKKADRMVDRMRYSLEESLGSSAVVEIKLKNGIVKSERVEFPLGTPANPMSDEQVIEKFLSCASFAAVPTDADAVVDYIFNIEEVGINRLSDGL